MWVNYLHKVWIKEFDKRQISDEQKIAKFAIQSNCEVCRGSFKDYKEPEYHHKTTYAKGGKSELDNIMVLCSDCHKKIHSKESIELPSEDELPENDEM